MFKFRKYAISMTRTVETKAEFNLDPLVMWNLIENISNYPRYIQFVSRVWFKGAYEKGNTWTDLTTVLVVPILVKHEILEVIYAKKAVYLIRMPLGGKIIQSVGIKPNKRGVELKITAAINMNNKFADLLLGEFIEKRIREMLKESMAKFSLNWL